MSNVHHLHPPTCVFTGRDLALIKRKFDRTCEELGVFPEDVGARSSLGRALVAAVARGEVRLSDGPAEIPGETEIISFEGEEMVVPASHIGH